ncbi:MAG: alternative ribosome rescue aminoacyl-tRNA hydrolase ArfB [Planctomycetota bacterium]
MLHVNDDISIPMSELKFSYARSPGPGGQNVNKVNTKAILRWSVLATQAIPGSIKQRLRTKHRKKISTDGDLIITSHRYRDQPRNVADCLAKLKRMILDAATVPKPRKKTKVPRSATRRRLENKRRKSEKKRLRSRFDD